MTSSLYRPLLVSSIVQITLGWIRLQYRRFSKNVSELEKMKNSNEKLQGLYANAANEFTLTWDSILCNWERVPNHNSVCFKFVVFLNYFDELVLLKIHLCLFQYSMYI